MKTVLQEEIHSVQKEGEVDCNEKKVGSLPSPPALHFLGEESRKNQTRDKQIPARTQTLKQTQRLRKSITQDKRLFPDLSRVITKATRLFAAQGKKEKGGGGD